MAEARAITDNMVLAAAEALVEYTAEKHASATYPPVDELQSVSQFVAARVIAQAITDGVAEAKDVTRDNALATVKERFWRPDYLPVVRD
jgi:malate dehydrogenase (oxaloacetate-decarboxylating)